MIYLQSSSPTITSLKILCTIKNIDYLTPKINCTTRWNSTYYMLKKFNYLQPTLQMLQADNRNV